MPGGHLSENALVELLAGSASLGDASEVIAHLDVCDACRAVLAHAAQARSTRWSTAPSDADLGDDLRVSPGDTIGRYVIMHAVGAGGMGVVYAAYDPDLDRRVALKVVRGRADASTGARLAREARLLARVNDPHVVSVHDVGYVGPHVYVVMDFVQGTTLRAWLAAARNEEAILEACVAAGRGLAAAHREGVVHRDFKPENVMVARDGRVYVADFGLALGPNDVAKAGVLAGTLAYMAPEQLRGDVTTAESDQFSFAVTVYEALFGGQPFDLADTRKERLRLMLAGPRRPRRAMTRLSTRVLPALERALAGDPSRRYATMKELLDQLAPPPRRLVAPLVATLAMLTVAATAFGFARTRAAPSPCHGVEQELEQVWNPDVAARVRTAFLGVPDAPFAETVLATVTRSLDVYTRAWASAATQACVATRVRGERSDAALDRAVACLDDRRRHVLALTRAFEHADRQTIERAAMAVGSLAEVETCLDPRLGSSVRRIPVDRGQRATTDRLEADLATYGVENDLGHYALVAEHASAIVKDARSLENGSLVAEGGILLGDALTNTGDAVGAERALLEAIWAAESAGDDRATARGFVELVRTTARVRPESDSFVAYERHAEAWLDRLGDSPALRARLLRSESEAASQLRKSAEALERIEVALKVARSSGAPDGIEVGSSLGTLAAALVNVGRLDDAKVAATQGLDILRKALGPGHPLAVTALEHLAEMRVDAGRYEEALAAGTEAIQLFEATVGKDTLQVAGAELTVAVALYRLRRFTEARTHLERELALCKRLVGDHVWTVDALSRTAGVDVALARLDDAGRELAEAAAMLGRLPKAPNDVRVDVVNEQVRWELASGNPARAERLLADATPLLAEVTDKRVLAEWALHQAKADQDPLRARAAAERARTLCREAELTDLAEEVDGWLVAHPAPG